MEGPPPAREPGAIAGLLDADMGARWSSTAFEESNMAATARVCVLTGVSNAQDQHGR